MSLFTRKEELTLTFDGENVLSFLKRNNNAYQNVLIKSLPLSLTIINNALENKENILFSLEKNFKNEIIEIKKKSENISDEDLFLNLIFSHGQALQEWMDKNDFQFKNEKFIKLKIKDLNENYHNDFLHHYNELKKRKDFNEEKELNNNVGVIHFLKSSVEDFHPISKIDFCVYENEKELKKRYDFYVKNNINPEKNCETYINEEYKNEPCNTAGLLSPENCYEYNFITLQHLFHASEKELKEQIVLSNMGNHSFNNLFGTLYSYNGKNVYLDYEKGETEKKFIKEFINYIQERLKDEGGEIITYTITPTPYYNKVDDEYFDFEQYDLFFEYKAKAKIQEDEFYKLKDDFYQYQKIKSKIDKQVEIVKNQDLKI